MKSRLLSFVLLVILCIGLYGSLKIVFFLFGIEADTSHSLVLWYGINSDGLKWIRDWLFTQDNWLLSLFPIHFFEFLIFGPKPILIVLTGWLIFVTSAFMAGLLAREVKAQNAAFLVPIILIFIGLYAHQLGFASYPVSHNITNLFGLVSFFAFIRWTKTHRPIFVFAIAFFLITGGLSDPWMVATYALPMTITSLILVATANKTERVAYLQPLTAAAISIIFIKSQMFGFLDFLPAIDYHTGDWTTINANAIFLIKDLGGLFNLVPWTRPNDFIPALLSTVIISALTVKLGSLCNVTDLASSRTFLAFLCFISISISGILLAFLLSNVAAADHSARFILNVLYLATTGLAVFLDLYWDRASKGLKLASLGVAALFITAGITSNFGIWVAGRFSMNDQGAGELISFLNKNNLSYGYGPYWGAHANAVTVLSKQKIRLRPAIFDKTTGMMIVGNRPQSSVRWYKPEDWPTNQTDYFIVVKNDGEECPDIGLCVRGLTEQFGEPARILRHADALIMVWDHPLPGHKPD